MKKLKYGLLVCLAMLGTLTLSGCGDDPPPHTHTMTHTEAQDATCTADGHIEYWHCEGCGVYFLDENGERSVEASATVTPMTPHVYGAWQTLTHPTCDRENHLTDGTKQRVCTCGASEQGIIPAAHDYGTDNTCRSCGYKLVPTESLTFLFDEAKDGYILTGVTAAATQVIIPYYYDDGINGSKPVVAIGESAFYNNTSAGWTSVIIPATVREIGEMAFGQCINLVEVQFDGVFEALTIGTDAFRGCRSLTSITLPDATSEIGEGAFAACTRLREVKLGAESRLAIIRTYAFADCVDLVQFTLPAALQTVELDAFLRCYKLIEVYNLSTLTVQAGSDKWQHVRHVYDSADAASRLVTDAAGFMFYRADGGSYLVLYTGESTAWQLPAGDGTAPYSIYPYAFYQNTDLVSLTLSVGVLSVGDHAFDGCAKLVSVNTAGATAWQSVGKYGFANCTKLATFTVPASVTLISPNAFYLCSDLLDVTFADAQGWFYTTSLVATEGTALELSDSRASAIQLKTTYVDKYWKKSV